MIFGLIHVHIKKIKGLILDPLGCLNEEISPQIIDEFISVFDRLFADGMLFDSVEAQIEDLLSQKKPEAELKACKLNFEYVQHIVALKDLLDSLPDEFPSKERLNTFLLEHCSLEWMEQVKKGGFSNSLEDFVAFRAEHYKEVAQSIVEVRTWGTKEELGSGLLNVIRQKIHGDHVGHVSLLMRVPVTTDNKALIEKYCLHENGALKIPYSIQRYANGLVYQIYWSYWPGRLNTPKRDIEEERRGFEFTTQSDVISRLPPELRERYLFHKQIKDFFEKQRTIYLAPVATPVGMKSYGILQQEFINLKLKKYRNEETIQALSTLLNQYFIQGKEFYSKSDQWGKKDIRTSSNFLTLIARFKNEMSSTTVCASILKEKKITIEQVKWITLEIDKLIDKKTAEGIEISKEIAKAQQEFYAPAVEIKKLKKEIKVLREKLTLHKKYNYFYKVLEAYKKQGKNKRIVINKFNEWVDAIGAPKEERLKFYKGTFTHEEIDELLLRIKNHQVNLQDKLKSANEKLEALYKAPKKETIRIYSERVKEKEISIKCIESKIAELQEQITEIEQSMLQVKRLKKPINFEYGTSEIYTVTLEVKESFKLKRDITGKLIWIIKDIVHAKQLIQIMRSDIRKLKEEAQIISNLMKEIRLQSNGEELSKDQIIRGIPTRNVTLNDFNIEAMLKTASELASTTSAFNLIEENCSTTSMKLLSAGAPKDMAHMFVWTQNTAANPASNAFLTNPQAVYSSAILVARAQAGDKNAMDRVKAEAFLTPNTDYYIKINKLLAYKDDKAQILNQIKSNFFSYLRIIPKLIYDLWITTDTKHTPRDEQEIDKYLNKLNDAVRNEGHSIISHQDPILAIQDMMERLQADPKGLPFFNEKTLYLVRKYLLDIESKEEQSEEHIQLLQEYSAIINERDDRLSCIELALIGNKQPGLHLMSRMNKAPNLKWAQTPALQAEIMVEQFYEEYQKIQAPKSFQFFRSNFLSTIPKHLSNAEKLKIIQAHIIEKPSSASAKAWSKCTFKKDHSDLVGENTNDVPLVTEVSTPLNPIN